MNTNTKKALYLECQSGISGDMTVAALLDLGADEKVLRQVLGSLPLDGYEVKITRVKKSAIDCCDFDVQLTEEQENHDHDMEYLFGHEHSHDDGNIHEYSHVHGHSHEEEHSHEHSHTHEHSHHHEHSHVHRGMKEIAEIIHTGEMTESARRLAIRIFEILAEAEAKAHGIPVSEVHFHEVGAVDSIVDIVSAAVCLDNLGVSEVIVPPMTEGHGTIRCQHGILPIPVPAVANIAAAHHLTLKLSNIQGELITPTGAAFVAAVKTGSELPPEAEILGIGLGAGKRKYSCPGFLRAMLVRIPENSGEEQICKLETNIDDCSGEVLGYVMERLFEAGARDVYYQPIFMKKNRPAWLLSVLCMETERGQLEAIIFRETTTIGVRRSYMERTVLPRKFGTVHTCYGEVSVKIVGVGENEFCYPEYEVVRAAAKKQHVSYQVVYEETLHAYKENGASYD